MRVMWRAYASRRLFTQCPNEGDGLPDNADDAQKALARVASGEADTLAGWLAYGTALNEGRDLFERNPRGDAAFGQWIVDHQLGGPHDLERAAAMWAAAPQHTLQPIAGRWPLRCEKTLPIASSPCPIGYSVPTWDCVTDRLTVTVRQVAGV